MKSSLGLLSVAVLFATCAIAAALPSEPEAKFEPLYMPVVAEYMNGEFIKIVIGGEPTEDQAECVATLHEKISAATQAGSIPKGGAVVGACIPFPLRMAPDAAAPHAPTAAKKHRVPAGVSVL